MKKYYALFSLLFLCISAACRSATPSGEAVSGSHNIETSTEEDRPSSILISESGNQADRYTFDFGGQSRFCSPFFPGKPSDVYRPAVSLCNNCTFLPDALDSFLGCDDVISESRIHVGALNLDLEIPDGFYIYRIPGQYWDFSTNQAVVLDFVREYVFTMMDVEEDKLVEDIQTFFSGEREDRDLAYRGPGYIVFSFRTFCKEYLPIENLFSSLLADTGEYFTSEQFYCSMGRSAWANGGGWTDYFENGHDPAAIDPLFREKTKEELLDERFYLPAEEFPLEYWVGEILDSTAQPAFSTESTTNRTGQPVWEKSGGFFYGAESMFKTGSASYYTRPNDLYEGYRIRNANITASIVNDSWWDSYLYAINQLNEKSHNFRYTEKLCIDFSEGHFSDHVDLMNDWYYRPEQTIELQAYVYANLAAFRTIDLYNIVILVRNIEGGGRLYIALLDEHPENDAPHELTLVEWSWDALQEGGLDFAREYAEKWL